MPLIVDAEPDYIDIAADSCESLARGEAFKLKLDAIQKQLSLSAGALPDEITQLNKSLCDFSDELISLFAATALLLRNVGSVFAEVDAEAANNIANTGG
jgi:hypothetical protein